MNELREKIGKLASEELERANSKFPPFNSTHEGQNVLREEVEEAEFEMACVKTYTSELWEAVKFNESRGYFYTTLNKIKQSAELLAAEAVQVSAMAQKFLDFMGEDKGE